jgi:hypothetical protein
MTDCLHDFFGQKLSSGMYTLAITLVGPASCSTFWTLLKPPWDTLMDVARLRKTPKTQSEIINAPTLKLTAQASTDHRNQYF